MRKLLKYKTIIVDVDGTLYHQTPVRIAMLKEMAFQFWRLREFLIVKRYRELYEKGYDEKKRLSMLPKDADQVIYEWMITRPLPYVYKYRDRKLLWILRRIRKKGIKVIIYSDYPVQEKLEVLQLEVDGAYSSEDTGCLKPDADGLLKILMDKNIKPEDCLVVGDRFEKDGLLALNLRCDSLILPKGNRKRIEIYKKLCYNKSKLNLVYLKAANVKKLNKAIETEV